MSPGQKLNAILRKLKVLGESWSKVECDFKKNLRCWVSPGQKLNAILRKRKGLAEFWPKIECDFKKT